MAIKRNFQFRNAVKFMIVSPSTWKWV